LKDFKWLPFPTSSPENPGHYKKFQEVLGEKPTEENLPSNVNNVRKVAELEQVSILISKYISIWISDPKSYLKN